MKLVEDWNAWAWLIASSILWPLAGASDEAFHFCALGDMPYYLPEDYERFDNVIASVNGENPAFTVHVGDTKSGSSWCSDENFERTLESFRKFDHPLIYTPGDNEWTDCHRPLAGEMDPLDRLAKIREMFFSTDRALGGGASFKLDTQSHDVRWKPYVENRMWIKNGVVFATLHIVGSQNNRQKEVPGAMEEFLLRDEANEAWLNTVFEKAIDEAAPGLALFIHANPFRELGSKESSWGEGFARFLAQLRERTLAFGKPVLLTHGDSHYFRIDKPLMRQGAPRDSLENFTRLEVFGARNMHAVRVDVNPASPIVFSIQQLIVPDNGR